MHRLVDQSLFTALSQVALLSLSLRVPFPQITALVLVSAGLSILLVEPICYSSGTMAGELDPVVVLHSLSHTQETTPVCKILPHPPLLVVPQEEALRLVPRGATRQVGVIRRKSICKTGGVCLLISYIIP